MWVEIWPDEIRWNKLRLNEIKWENRWDQIGSNCIWLYQIKYNDLRWYRIVLDWMIWDHIRSVGTGWDQMRWDFIGWDQIKLNQIICDSLDQARWD